MGSRRQAICIQTPPTGSTDHRLSSAAARTTRPHDRGRRIGLLRRGCRQRLGRCRREPVTLSSRRRSRRWRGRQKGRRTNPGGVRRGRGYPG